MGRVSAQYTAVLRSSLMSKKLAAVSRDAEWLFLKLLLAIDSQGCFHAKPFNVCAQVLTPRFEAGTVTVADAKGWLDELEAAGLIARYEADGDELLQVCNFYRPKSWAKGALFPAPDWNAPGGAPTALDGAPDFTAPAGAPTAPQGSPTAPKRTTEAEAEAEAKAEAEADARPREEEGIPVEAEKATCTPEPLAPQPRTWGVPLPDWVVDALQRSLLDPLRQYATELRYVAKADPNLLDAAIVQLAKDLRPQKGPLTSHKLIELASNHSLIPQTRGACREALRQLDEAVGKARQPKPYLRAGLTAMAAGRDSQLGGVAQ